MFLADIYSKITEKGCEYVGPIEVAEAAKMIENTQRDIDIAFMNELAKILPEMGLDVVEVIDACLHKVEFPQAYSWDRGGRALHSGGPLLLHPIE